jgi:transcriptional regulator with XRE-family HTH domain
VLKSQNSSFDEAFLIERISILIGDEPKDFAFQVGISLSCAYNYRNGRVPTLAILFRIAETYGKPLGWFLRSKGGTATPVLHERRLEVVPPRRAAIV